MRYFSAFQESFYYAYRLGPDVFRNARPAPVTSLSNGLARSSDLSRIDLEAANVLAPQLGAPGSIASPLPHQHHTLVPRNCNHRSTSLLKRYCWSSSIPPRAFILVGSGIYMSTPEFTFLQLSRVLSPVELALAGCALCASYYIDASTDRITRREPITSVERIGAFLEDAQSVRGVSRAQARLDLIANGAESPQEVNMFLMARLPVQLGGNGIEGLKLNYEIPVTKDDAPILDRPDRTSFRIDMGRPEHHDGAEYLGKHHDEQVDRDRERMNALVAKGERVLQVKHGDLADPEKAERLANQLARLMGVELPNRTPAELVAKGHLANTLFGVGRPRL